MSLIVVRWCRRFAPQPPATLFQAFSLTRSILNPHAFCLTTTLEQNQPRNVLQNLACAFRNERRFIEQLWLIFLSAKDPFQYPQLGEPDRR